LGSKTVNCFMNMSRQDSIPGVTINRQAHQNAIFKKESFCFPG